MGNAALAAGTKSTNTVGTSQGCSCGTWHHTAKQASPRAMFEATFINKSPSFGSPENKEATAQDGICFYSFEPSKWKRGARGNKITSHEDNALVQEERLPC